MQTFLKNGNFSSAENFSPFFPVLSNKTKSVNNLWEDTMCFDKFCASYKIISLGPKKSIIEFFKKNAIFTVTKDFGQLCLVLSGVANLREQFISVLKAF